MMQLKELGESMGVGRTGRERQVIVWRGMRGGEREGTMEGAGNKKGN